LRASVTGIRANSANVPPTTMIIIVLIISFLLGLLG
jgi:hypothetical protein